MRQDRHDRRVVCLLDALADDRRVEGGRGLVHDQGDPRHLELLGHVHGDPGALVVLLVRAQDHQEGVGHDQRQQGLLLQSGVGVDEERVELERVDELAQSLDQLLRVVPVAQHRVISPGRMLDGIRWIRPGRPGGVTSMATSSIGTPSKRKSLRTR